MPPEWLDDVKSANEDTLLDLTDYLPSEAAEARSFCQAFFNWYNNEHRHTGIGLFTPECVHYGRAEGVYTSRKEVLRAAYEAHPERFVKRIPAPPQLPTAAWINKPNPGASEQRKSTLN